MDYVTSMGNAHKLCDDLKFKILGVE